MNRKIFTNKHQAYQTLAQDLTKELQENKNPILLLYSGGSSLLVLHELKTPMASQNITAIPLDERFDPTNKNSNSHAAKEIPFIKNLVHVIDGTTHPHDTLATLTERLNKSVQTWIEHHPNGAILAIAGIGNHGHIAGIFPTKTEEEFVSLFNTNDYVVGYTTRLDQTNPYRITATLTLLKRCNIIYVLSADPHDTETLREAETKKPHEAPARLLFDLNTVAYCV